MSAISGLMGDQSAWGMAQATAVFNSGASQSIVDDIKNRLETFRATSEEMEIRAQKQYEGATGGPAQGPLNAPKKAQSIEGAIADLEKIYTFATETALIVRVTVQATNSLTTLLKGQ